MTPSDVGGAKLSAGEFWKLIGARPVAVPVVAARGEGGPAGLLALSATHVSAEPPMMLVAVGASTSALPTIKAAGAFSINYLSEEAAETAEIFGGRRELRGADRFEAGKWSVLETGAPTFLAAYLVMDCVVEGVFDCRGTDLIVGRIVAHRTDDAGRPLLSYRGRYRGIGGG